MFVRHGISSPSRSQLCTPGFPSCPGPYKDCFSVGPAIDTQNDQNYSHEEIVRFNVSVDEVLAVDILNSAD